MSSSFLNKVAKFLSLPVSRKFQYLQNGYFKIKGMILYRVIFKDFGNRSILRRPLFISYESVMIGDNVFIWDDARIETVERHADKKYSATIRLGNGVTIEQRCHITAASDMVIGDGVTILFDVMITDIDHEYENVAVSVRVQKISVKNTSIGENCFIGSGAKILAGTVLGRHCIVGANAVVRGEFQDYCVIVGSPAVIIKRFNSETQTWDRTDSQGLFLAKS